MRNMTSKPPQISRELVEGYAHALAREYAHYRSFEDPRAAQDALGPVLGHGHMQVFDWVDHHPDVQAFLLGQAELQANSEQMPHVGLWDPARDMSDREYWEGLHAFVEGLNIAE